jgi:hypothetical protein
VFSAILRPCVTSSDTYWCLKRELRFTSLLLSEATSSLQITSSCVITNLHYLLSVEHFFQPQSSEISSSSSDNEEYSWATQADIDSIIKYLNRSKRILALCGAGLSAPSGIPTYRDSGAYWKGHKAASISSIDTFKINPGLVWRYFTDRRLVLKAKPNRGHVALAKITQKKPGFVCLTQNIDGADTDSICST